MNTCKHRDRLEPVGPWERDPRGEPGDRRRPVRRVCRRCGRVVEHVPGDETFYLFDLSALRALFSVRRPGR